MERERIKEVTPSLSNRTMNAVTTIQNQLKEAALEKHFRKERSLLLIKSHINLIRTAPWMI